MPSEGLEPDLLSTGSHAFSILVHSYASAIVHHVANRGVTLTPGVTIERGAPA